MSTPIRQLRAEPVDDRDVALGEGPTWDTGAGRLVWVDILAGSVCLADAAGIRVATFHLGGHVSAALPATGGGWLVTRPDGFGFLDATGIYREVLAVEADRPQTRFNDAKCDPAGRAWAGTMRYDEQPGDATLYRLDAGPVATPVLTAQGLCNGLAWSPDGETMYFVDSCAGAVVAFDYDVEHGELRRPGVVVAAGAPGVPDGLCVDQEGYLWVARYGAGVVHRYRPDGGLAAVVDVGGDYPTSVAFGGPDGDRLFITAATGPSLEPGRDPSRGGLFALEPGMTGPPATPWQSCGPAERTSRAHPPEAQQGDHHHG